MASRIWMYFESCDQTRRYGDRVFRKEDLRMKDATLKQCGLKPVKQKKAKGDNLLRVDYSIKPSLIDLVIESHPTRTGTAMIDPKKVQRISMLRSGESSITGHEYLRRLKESGEELYDVRVMEEFLKNPEKIPEEWKTGRIYFWGTIFRSGGNLFVQYLDWVGGRWRWGCCYLDNDWNSNELAAVAASK